MQSLRSEAQPAHLDLHRIAYWRAVAIYAARVNAGANPLQLCSADAFVTDPKLARLVPGFSISPPLFEASDLNDGPPLRLHQVLARHCLLLDVLHCLARYHDEELARFWSAQLALPLA